jgi:hypothetical protein
VNDQKKKEAKKKGIGGCKPQEIGDQYKISSDDNIRKRLRSRSTTGHISPSNISSDQIQNQRRNDPIMAIGLSCSPMISEDIIDMDKVTFTM